MISKIPIDTDKKIIERYEKRADFTVYKLLLSSGLNLIYLKGISFFI